MSREGTALVNEREQIEQYLSVHGLEPHLNSVINATVRLRPEDPFTAMASQLQEKR
jgi:hypothetical protein